MLEDAKAVLPLCKVAEMLLSAHLHHLLCMELVSSGIYSPLSERHWESREQVPQRPDRKEKEEMPAHQWHCSILLIRGFARAC